VGWKITLISIIDKFRKISEHPVEKLQEIGVKEGMTFLDVGCTLGFYSFPAATLVGKKGLVIALDKNPECIEWVANKVKKKALTNIKTVVADACNLGLPEHSVDIVFLHLVLHDIDDKPKAIKEFHKVLKNHGKLVIDEEHAMPLSDIRDLAEHEGFKFSKCLWKTMQVFEKITV
jgi:ubiquinone/menaquinone biosynthesis C-methylase UbiE